MVSTAIPTPIAGMPDEVLTNTHTVNTTYTYRVIDLTCTTTFTCGVRNKLMKIHNHKYLPGMRPCGPLSIFALPSHLVGSHVKINNITRGVLYGSILGSYLKCKCLYVSLVPFYEERTKINFFSKIFNFWRFPTEKMKMAGFWPKIQVFFNVFQRFPRNETCGAYKHHFGMAKHIVKYVIDDIYPKTG